MNYTQYPQQEVREALQVINRMTTSKFSDNLANRFDYCDNLRIFNAVLA